MRNAALTTQIFFASLTTSEINFASLSVVMKRKDSFTPE
jgi:hypothetical protein